MALKIIISSAVELLEKTSVKSKLQEMEKNHLIKIDELYDCNEHGVFWDITPKQEEINRFIVNADWFICLLPEYQVGKATWEELKLAIEAQKNGAKIVISVFHPKDFPNEKKTEEVPDKKVTYEFVEAEAKRLYGSELHQYFEPYEYGNNEDLLQKVEDHYAKAYKDRKFWSLHVGGNAIRGIEVKARDLFFDKLRAEAEWGFREGQDVYIWRNSVDGKMNQRLNRYGCRFLFITGRPSSGKSRALYEFTHSTLKDQQVVLMGADNVVSICDSLMVDVRQAKRDPEQSYAKAFCQTQYYFVCDQINDVFQQAQVPTELKLGFLNAISEQENCCLLATGTRAALEDFVEDSRDIISPIDGNYNDGNSDLITIPLLSKDADSQEILARLRHQYSISDGETIGDFITELNKLDGFDLAADATAAAVAKAISDKNYTTDSAGAKALAEALNKGITGDPKGTASVAADATSGTISGLVAGYYLVKDTAAVSNEGASTKYILEVVKNVTVAEKASVPTVDKKIAEATPKIVSDYNIGDKIPYTITGTLPSTFANFATYKTFTFTDEMSNGLTPPNANAVTVKIGSDDITALTPPSFPYSTLMMETTLSLAMNPLTREVTIRQSPRPAGLNSGTRKPEITARILSLEFVTRFSSKSKLCRNQTTMVATRITENALCRKSFAFSQRSCRTLRGLGRR